MSDVLGPPPSSALCQGHFPTRWGRAPSAGGHHQPSSIPTRAASRARCPNRGDLGSSAVLFPTNTGGRSPPAAPQGLPTSPGRGSREGSKAAVPHLCFQLVYFCGLDVARFIAFASGEKDPELALGVPHRGELLGAGEGPWCAQRVGSTSPCHCPSHPGLLMSSVWMAPPEVPDSHGVAGGQRGRRGGRHGHGLVLGMGRGSTGGSRGRRLAASLPVGSCCFAVP